MIRIADLRWLTARERLAALKILFDFGRGVFISEVTRKPRFPREISWMHTEKSPDNPFSYNRHGFAWECVPRAGEMHLDFGCSEGDFLGKLANKQILRRVGVDVCREAIEAAKKKHPEIEFLHMRDIAPLPFPDKTFSSITIMEVIEHLDEQSELLDELHRVLSDDGTLILTTPGQYVFSALDMGNFKFRFPKLHRWYYCWRHSREEYEYKYVSNPDGLVGDISAKKRWHEHFSHEGIRSLLGRSGFEVVELDGSSFFNRPLLMIGVFFEWLPPIRRCFQWLYRLDSRWFESSNLFCVAKKHAF